jgi:transposase
MSLQLGHVQPIPENTTHVARAAFPDGHPYLQLLDQLGTLFSDTEFAGLYPRRGQPALAPWRLALGCV